MRSPRTATKSSPRSPQLEKAQARSNEDPMQPKINKFIGKKKYTSNESGKYLMILGIILVYYTPLEIQTIETQHKKLMGFRKDQNMR